MELKVDFSGLEELRKRIGAQVAAVAIKTPELPPLPSVLQQLLEDGSVDLEDLSDVTIDTKTDLLHIHGHQIVLYIPDQSYPIEEIQRDASKGKRYHLSWCRTLEDMKSQGRFQRYVAYTDPNQQFRIYHGGKEGKARLQVCKNCLSKLKIHEKAGSFDLKTFFAKHKTHFESLPERTTYTMQPNDYTKDWDKISKERRERANWICQGCGINLSSNHGLLHVHHVNGRKDDNHDENLRVLCVECHAKQPNHQHLKPKSNEQNKLDKLRREQKLKL